MCCFSRHVEAVSGTNIFARSGPDGRQVLVYSMTLSSKEDVAMILPLPVPANSPEDALKWISLKEYPDFFQDLHRGFPPPAADPPLLSKSEPKPRALAVVEVGDFEASFVPSAKDFERLDERFRLPSTPPAAKGFGFAVFKLKQGSRKVHPMAFDFPRANPARLFFPTLHIHDGKVHETVGFDHALFAQNREGERLEIQDWRESDQPASAFVKIAKARGVVDGERHVYLREIRGPRKNEDVVV
jgi:hypothetical protein